MKAICKNCVHAKPSYKGSVCEIKQKKAIAMLLKEVEG